MFVYGPASQGRSSVTEQDILNTLTTHAERIADSVLSNKEAGQNLEADVRVSFIYESFGFKVIISCMFALFPFDI